MCGREGESRVVSPQRGSRGGVCIHNGSAGAYRAFGTLLPLALFAALLSPRGVDGQSGFFGVDDDFKTPPTVSVVISTPSPSRLLLSRRIQ